MAINPHHTVEEIEGVRCSVIERNVSIDRAEFLKAILLANGLHVIISAPKEEKVTIGVTDITYSWLVALYSRHIKKPDGTVVNPAYWYQKDETVGFYWQY
jgi:hypothetical protein